LFLGEYTHSLDKEARLALPARLREAAGDQLAAGLCLICGVQPCIVAYTREHLESLLGGLETDPSIGKIAARDFKRFLGSNAAFAVPDKQGRILIPDSLRRHANIRKNVTIVGAVDVIEIWATESYKRRAAARRAVFEQLAPRILG